MEFQLQHQASNEYSGLISLRIDWFNLLAVQGTQESSPTPQFKSINSLALSFLYSLTCSTHMTTRKTIVLTRWTFDGKVMSLLFNMVSRLIIAFLPGNKCLLISWLQLPSAVIMEPPQNKVSHLAKYKNKDTKINTEHQKEKRKFSILHHL